MASGASSRRPAHRETDAVSDRPGRNRFPALLRETGQLLMPGLAHPRLSAAILDG